MPLHIETPVVRSQALSRLSGKEVWLKLEALQPPGSFKLRGVGAACEHHAQRGARRLISSSGGNAGIAVAYSGRMLGLPVTVYVPESTTQHARDLIKREGATVVVHGASWQEANALAQTQVSADTAFVHPFDDELLWRGHATLVDELAAAACNFDAIVLSVGGGGLLCGVVEGLRRNGLSHIPVIAVETAGADSLAQSVAAGSRIELPAITSVATSLGAKQICAGAFDVVHSHDLRSQVVTDQDAILACQRFLDDHRLLVEPACGASLALAYGALPDALAPFKRPLFVVCGGATTSARQLERWRTER
ncbi:pyridoxal-phosphate dependent enzyme [Ideonella margarita]|uniref:L-serine ammonia-lyase n=1 Tax=Ideonella margarita TaxID=2984191 RepID=A0ABU9C306_9BURK